MVIVLQDSTVPENIHSHPMKCYWQLLQGGGWSQKSKFLKGSTKLKNCNNSRGGGRIQTTAPSVGGLWIFSAGIHP